MLPSQRLACCLASLVILHGCGGSDSTESENQARSTAPAQDDSSFQLGLSRLPDDLMRVVELRREYVAALEVEPMLADGETTAETLRDVLLQNQAFVEAAIEASRKLDGMLPASIELSDEDVHKDLHLSQPRTILVNNARLLRADAVRCWEEEAIEKCTERFSATLDLAAFLLRHEDRASRFRGGTVLITTLFDLDAVCQAGFPDAAPASLRSELGARIRSIDPHACLHWDDTSKAAAVRRSLLEKLRE